MNQPLWTPGKDRVERSNMIMYLRFLEKEMGKTFHDYKSLWEWSVVNRDEFWPSIWRFGQVKASKEWDQVVEDRDTMLGTKWFLGARLNFAENLLRFRDERKALVFKGEGRTARSVTYAQLYDQVAGLAHAMRAMGIKTGDRVAGFMPNLPETVAAMLAAASIGAIWSSCSPDFGIKGVLDRFGQIEPKLLFTADGYFYNGKTFDSIQKISGIIQHLPSVEKIVVVPYTKESPDISLLPNAVHFQEFMAGGQGDLVFEQLPFDHPLYIMYSSGTTGVPKCIVHGAGGTLLQHIKELWLHTNVTRDSKIFYYTTCGWMMWNWLTSALTAGATILLYDGSPFHPEPGTLWEFAQEQGMTIFGTSAKYLAALEKEGVRPRESYDLSSLETICSTGSPLSVESFEFVYRDIKKDVCLSSISGGTDIISCFALGNPTLPVWPGELQCRGLGMKVAAYNEDGKPVIGAKGELVCEAPFVSMPIYFWNDPDNAKYKAAYFERFDNVWHHGDFIEITEHDGVIIYGRSDATLNPGGVRIGTAEIYRQVESIAEVLDSLVVGQEWDNDVRVILFVKLKPGITLTEELRQKIKTTIRSNTTPRHVPSKIIQVADIPYTISGKKVELAVRKVIHGEPVLNKDALANPNSLDLYHDLDELKS
ncbi:MAG: acetoacetate--CoA ligase [Deltaproteobacteria bacterium]|nr:acetoacetate--CoA ligase [Deltaproteobacteria bacterium]